jgi:3-hydroxyacyl-CoA dehydrogenase
VSTNLTLRDNIGVVTIDNPPVNATSHSVRQALWEIIDETEGRSDIKAVVLICAGKTFIAGADVKEFGKPPRAPSLPNLLQKLENTQKPWVAAIHGHALGGGLETAMVCRHRIASEDAKLGLPETQLGLIPGAGGTVRLPRLIAADFALEMILSGKPILANVALERGLIDCISTGELLEDAIRFAEQLATEPLAKKTSNRDVKPTSEPARLEAIAETALRKARGFKAPAVAIQAIRNSLAMPVDAALAAETEAFQKLRQDPQSAALRHIFFAERATTKDPRLTAARARDISKIGVVGGGTMGAGIAAACLIAGYDVTMVERDREAANLGQNRVLAILDSSRKRGVITANRHAALFNAFATSDSYGDFGEADLVIEAVFEDMDVKKSVFAALEKHTPPKAILATNTSYLDVNDIAAGLTDPTRVVGLHFFSPAHIMKLLEVVVAKRTDNNVLSTVVRFAKRLRKLPVLSGVCDGFIANRIMSAYRRECEYMLEDGALPWDIDAAMTDFGLPMGIFQMQDMAGLDISWAMRKRQATTRDPDLRYVEIGDKLCEMGRFGRKTGRGYYLYEDGKSGVPDPDVEALILSESNRKGISRRAIKGDEIMERVLRAMHAEAGKILAEGVARHADDIDVVMVNAYGFPRWRGGPMYSQHAE